MYNIRIFPIHYRDILMSESVARRECDKYMSRLFYVKYLFFLLFLFIRGNFTLIFIPHAFGLIFL